MRSKGKGLFAFVIFVLAITIPIMADGAVISVDSVSVVPGEKFQVGVRMSGNTNTISALMVPLKFTNSYLSVDSVSFVNSILPGSFRGVVDVDNNADVVKISYIPDQFSSPLPTMSNVSGLIATIHFSLAPGATPGTTAITAVNQDSVVQFAGQDIHRWVRVEFSDQSGSQAYLPSFDPGSIVVQISTGIDDDNNGLLPNEFSLGQNYPNPFNPSTTIDYALPKAGYVSLRVYNVIGQEVAVLYEGFRSAGVHQITFDGGNFPSGVYFYQFKHEEGSDTRKMMMVK